MHKLRYCRSAPQRSYPLKTVRSRRANQGSSNESSFLGPKHLCPCESGLTCRRGKGTAFFSFKFLSGYLFVGIPPTEQDLITFYVAVQIQGRNLASPSNLHG